MESARWSTARPIRSCSSVPRWRDDLRAENHLVMVRLRGSSRSKGLAVRPWILALAFLCPFVQAAQAQTTDHYALLMVWMPGLCKLEPSRAECKDLTLRR